MKYVFSIAPVPALVLMASFILWFGETSAQVKNEEVTVIAAYEPSLSDVNKISVNPDIVAHEPEKAELKYNVTPRLLPTFFEPVKITPVRMSGEPLNKLYQSYIRAGFGNYTTPYAELFYNNLRSRTTNMGLSYKHYSSHGKIKDYGPAAFSDNVLNVFGSYFSENHIFNANLLYKRNGFHYYGFKPSELGLPLNDSLKKATFMAYSTLEGEASVKSDYSDKDKVHHMVSLKYYNLKNTEVVENAFGITASLSKNFDAVSKIDDEKAMLVMQADIYNNPAFTTGLNGAVYAVKPQVSFRMNQYALTAGVNVSIEDGESEFIHFFPIIEGQIAIARDVLSLYGSFTGNVTRNNIRQIFEENPFITPVLDSLMFTKNKVLFKGGLKGNIASVFSFNLGASFNESNNMPFFVNDTGDIYNRFTLVYDDVQAISAFAGFTFQASEKFMLMLNGQFNHYTMGIEEHAWHKPMLKGSIAASYILVDKINIKAEIYGQDKTYARLFGNSGAIISQDINAFADINLSLEYLYNKKISAFLNLNNVSGVRYNRWYNHPSQRFHMMAGLTYAF